jgi:patatin-like phospholipase/acyl hydrolase
MAYTIVSFCGGGIRGLLSATLLERLAVTCPQILTNTTLFAGTSTGSLIVSGLVKTDPLTPTELIAYYRFVEAPFFAYQSLNPNGPAYSNSGLISNQQGWHGSDTLASLLDQPRPRQVLFTAFSLTSSGTSPTWYPQLFNNVPQVVTLIPQFDNADTLIADAVIASGSMPGMLPSYQGNVDGAFVHHDPTLSAIALALNAGINLSDIAVICFGTGFMPNYIGVDTTTWGSSVWTGLEPLPAGNYALPPLLVDLNTVMPILNVSLNGTSSNLMQLLGTMMLGNRYVSLNPLLTQYVPENASSDADLDALIQAAMTCDLSAAQKLVEEFW